MGEMHENSVVESIEFLLRRVEELAKRVEDLEAHAHMPVEVEATEPLEWRE